MARAQETGVDEAAKTTDQGNGETANAEPSDAPRGTYPFDAFLSYRSLDMPTPTLSDPPTKSAVAPVKRPPSHTGSASCQDTQCTLSAGAAKPIEGLQRTDRICVSVGRGDEQVQRTCRISANNTEGALCTLDVPFSPQSSSGSWSRGVCP